ncbi:hypothetical protein ACFQJ5_09295 [Halomicroarcula sp. GCM10025324]|uniref:hypothetical protein n=1 Tax=Haloarcula TaxID=2237 RepID=UPI0023E85EFA|nr:hypothetical protein [Halomicroarcula sp. ZS-22-S1]
MDRPSFLDSRSLDQLAALTGLGWTSSLCGYLVLWLGYGPGVLERALVESEVLLYVGVGFFLATLGLDRIARAWSGAPVERPGDSGEDHTESSTQPAD